MGDPVCPQKKSGDKYCTGDGLMPDFTNQYCTQQASSKKSHMLLYLGIGGGVLLLLLFFFFMMSRGSGH